MIQNNNTIRNNKKIIITAAIAAVLLIILDQITKAAAVACLKNQAPFILIPGVLEFYYLQNQSAAFSIDPVSLFQKIFRLAYFEQNPEAFLQAKMIFFILLTILVIILICMLFLRIPAEKHFYLMDLTLVLLVSGAAGNLIDRIMQNYVVDFIYFSLIDFPIFNVADIYVTCAAFMLILEVIFYYHEEDFDRIFPSREKKSRTAK